MAKTQAEKPAEQTEAAQTAKPVKFKKKRNVTLQLIKLTEEKPAYLEFTGAMYEAKPLKKVRVDAETGQPVKKPPTLCNVINLETGEEGNIIVNEVLKGTLNDEFPNDSYVGKQFEITRHKIADNKNYATFSIVEIEVEK